MAMQAQQRDQLLAIAALKQQASAQNAIADMVASAADAGRASLAAGIGQSLDIAA
jgi:hypothetical protein